MGVSVWAKGSWGGLTRALKYLRKSKIKGAARGGRLGLVESCDNVALATRLIQYQRRPVTAHCPCFSIKLPEIGVGKILRRERACPQTNGARGYVRSTPITAGNWRPAIDFTAASFERSYGKPNENMRQEKVAGRQQKRREDLPKILWLAGRMETSQKTVMSYENTT